MVTLKRLTVAVAATLVWGLSAPGVQIPAGNYTNSFSGTAALYDISGTYSDPLGGFSFDYTLNMDSSGKFTGQGVTDFSDFTAYGVDGRIDASFSGTVKTANSVTRVTMTVKAKGWITTEGATVKVSENVKARMEIMAGSGRMVGTMSGSVTASGMGKSKTQKIPPTPVYFDLPAGEDGSWNLTLNLAPAGNKYSGTATAVVGRGNSYPLTVSGTYSPKSDMSKLILKGQQAMTLKVVAGFQNAQIQIESVKGKALGQRLQTQ